ncbi:MAG: protein-L-isoaspartate(D-aspartate) O-methyltransferase [Zoogloeaceae bacterium]|jgi:protein-L-isoaspartate(D-aspartate) O-methyltransferase|nr:protein-L-isoaspartate(D-aspartate) O-methyltransferase [Zoogloeaceae bacterium]
MTPSAQAGIGFTSLRSRARMVDALRQKGIRNEAVLAAIQAVPRHLFVDEALAHRVYDYKNVSASNYQAALPIGFGQTLSHPYTVARMIEILLDRRAQLGKTLEIGAGSGYQAAVLSHLTEEEVWAVERIAPLLARARQTLARIPEVRVRLELADGTLGWPAAAPFHSIIMAAAARQAPAELLSQLAPGGRLVLPLLSTDGKEQYLHHIERTPRGFTETRLESVRFVPLLSGIAS